MGIINQGILGGFSGKVGPIVGFRWKSNYYIRARAAKVSNPRTPKQQEQRGKFATAFSFLKAIKPFIRIGYKEFTQDKSAFNSAMSYTLKRAVTGSGKEIKITYEYQWKKGCIRIHIPKVSVDEKVEIVFEQKLTLNDNHTLERVYDLLNQAQDSNLAKESAYRLLSSGKNLADILGELETTNLKKEIRLAVIEIMTADL